MPQTDFRYLLSQDAEIVVELITEQGKISSYSVVLLAREEGEWRTVRVYDNHLGVPHMHRYTRGGIKGDGEKAGQASPSDGYNAALEQVRTGFQGMIDGWHRS